MSLFGSIGLTKERGSSTTSFAQDVVSSEDELQKQKQTEQASTTDTGITSTLDEQTQQLVKDLVGKLSSGVLDAESSGLAELSTAILERSKTAQADVTGQISSITEDARLKGEQELQQLQTQLAQQSGGSKANTLVASATGVGRANLESQIARTKGELNLQARQVVSDELASALTGVSQAQAQASQTPVENITNLLNVLKGATVEQQQVGEKTSTTESELTRMLNAISKTTGSQIGHTKGQTITGKLGFKTGP